MAREVNELNRTYDKVFASESTDTASEEAVRKLFKKRDWVLTLFEDNQISQEQYNWLDSKISEYIEKFQKDRAI
jgi:hypothetical protein